MMRTGHALLLRLIYQANLAHWQQSAIGLTETMAPLAVQTLECKLSKGQTESGKREI